MYAAPQRVSLITQTQAVLMEGMRQGRWRHELPGERVLSRELRVSRWTLRAALSGLAKEGYIKVVHGLPSAILPAVAKAADQATPVRNVAMLMPAPLSKLRLFYALWIDELRLILSERGISVTLLDWPKAYGMNPQRTLEKLIEKHPNNDWILLLSTRAIQEWFQHSGVFAVVAGTRFEGITLPAVDITVHDVGVHVGHTLLGLGHRRWAYFMPRIPNAGALAVQAGLQQAIARAPGAEVHLHVETCDEDTVSVCRAVDRVQARPQPPTVIIALRASLALTAATYLMRRGIRIPQDVSLVAIDSESFLDLVVPRIAQYHVSPMKVAKLVARALQHDAARSDAAYVTPEFVAGESLQRLSLPSAAR